MITKFRRILKTVYLFPFNVLMCNIGSAETAVVDVVEEKPPMLDDPEHAAAIARGDVIVIPEPEKINPELLAEIAGNEELVVATDVKKDDGTIPRPRFNEVIEENRRLKEQLELMNKTAVTTEVATQEEQSAVVDPREKLKELRRQQKDLEIEGDLDAANQVGDQIDELILEVATTRARSTVHQENQATSVKNSLADVAVAAYEKYPFLDVDSPDVDSDAVNAVIIRRNELIGTGKSPAEALQAAVDEKGPKFARLLGVTSITQQTTELTADQVRAAREKAAKEKGAEASLMQPAELPNKTEKENFAVDVKTLSPAQIKAMPEEQKARLRGDIM